MIELRQFSKKDVIPDHDYLIEKTDKFKSVVNVLTPKFEGRWIIVFLEPKLAFVKELIEDATLPEWVDFLVLMGKAKIDKVVINYPNYAPKERTAKDIVNASVIGIKNLITDDAKNALQQIYGKNEKDLVSMLSKLDSECSNGIITLKQIKESIHYEKQVYASDVMNAFLRHDRVRWVLYNKLVHDLGLRYAYNALNNYVRKLITEKNSYLNNDEVTKYIVKNVDAPFLCYVYVIFSNSNDYRQLHALMYSIDNRSAELLERIQNVNL